MENLELRKAVYEALDKKAILLNENLYEDCIEGCLTPHVFVKPYELDHHAAMDALEEFCGDTYGYMEHRFPGPPNLFEVFICNDDWEIISAGRDNSRALAICQAIEIAAQKSEKKEAGE